MKGSKVFIRVLKPICWKVYFRKEYTFIFINSLKFFFCHKVKVWQSLWKHEVKAAFIWMIFIWLDFVLMSKIDFALK